MNTFPIYLIKRMLLQIIDIRLYPSDNVLLAK